MIGPTIRLKLLDFKSLFKTIEVQQKRFCCSAYSCLSSRKCPVLLGLEPEHSSIDKVMLSKPQTFMPPTYSIWPQVWLPCFLFVRNGLNRKIHGLDDEKRPFWCYFGRFVRSRLDYEPCHRFHNFWCALEGIDKNFKYVIRLEVFRYTFLVTGRRFFWTIERKIRFQRS